MFGVIQSPPAPAKPDFDVQLWHEQIVPTSGNTKTRKCQKTTGCHSSRCAFSYGFFVYVYINIVSQRQPLMITRKSRHQLQTSTKIEKKEKKKNSFRTSFTGNTQKKHIKTMAGLESMIVEEKQPPTKSVDREKVNPFSISLVITQHEC